MDDVRLPGMLHSAIVRSPFAHAKINNVDVSAALELEGIHAVITGADLEAQGLAWMPTLAGDTQAVLATDKVRFQGQGVAFVVAEGVSLRGGSGHVKRPPPLGPGSSRPTGSP